jgi:hypothetical protein
MMFFYLCSQAQKKAVAPKFAVTVMARLGQAKRNA